MYVLQAGEAFEDSGELLCECLLRIFDLASVESFELSVMDFDWNGLENLLFC